MCLMNGEMLNDKRRTSLVAGVTAEFRKMMIQKTKLHLWKLS